MLGVLPLSRDPCCLYWLRQVVFLGTPFVQSCASQSRESFSHGWFTMRYESSDAYKAVVSCEALGFSPQPQGPFESSIFIVIKASSDIHDVLDFYPFPRHTPHILLSPSLLSTRRPHSQGFSPHLVSVRPCVQWSAKYHFLRVCLAVFSPAHRARSSLHLFRVALLSP